MPTFFNRLDQEPKHEAPLQIPAEIEIMLEDTIMSDRNTSSFLHYNKCKSIRNSDSPIAARCRVPNSFGNPWIFCEGKISTWYSNLIVSLIILHHRKGVFGIKILISNSPDTSASKGIPVEIYLARFCYPESQPRPQFYEDSYTQQLWTKAWISFSSELIGVAENRLVALPKRSSPVRISE